MSVSVRLSVRLSVTEVHWRIIARFQIPIQIYRALCSHCAGSPQCARACGRIVVARGARREEGRGHLALCWPLLGLLVKIL